MWLSSMVEANNPVMQLLLTSGVQVIMQIREHLANGHDILMMAIQRLKRSANEVAVHPEACERQTE